MVDLAKLEKQTESIPSMGGLKIGPLLREAAKNADPGTSIVEVGSWLGAGSAQIAMGLLEAGKDLPVHCYDNWEAHERQIPKAASVGLEIHNGQDTLPVIQNLLAPFKVDFRFHKGDIRDITWDEGPVSIFIDDASKSPKLFQHVLRVFGPHFIPGKTVLFLMDYYHWEKNLERPELKCQQEFMEAHPDNFKRISERSPGYSLAQFLYTKEMNLGEVEL